MLKSAAEVLETDPRFADLVVADAAGTRSLKFEDHHSIIARLEIPTTASPNVRSAFDRARVCFLYAWFDYELMVVAEAQAFASLELALKERLGPAPTKKEQLIGLRARLTAAVERGFLKPQVTDGTDLYGQMVRLRNDLMHGGADVHPPAFATEIIRWCAELFGELCSAP